jgi:UMF1 family MFS transporter
MMRPMTAAPARPRSRWTVPAWCLYDFANSTFSAVIVATAFQVYYTTKVVGNADGAGDRWWGLAANGSALLVAVTAPVLGAIADLSGARRLLWTAFTAVAVACTALLVTVQPGDVVWGCVLFGLANYGTEAATNFYNAYLPEIVPPERIGRVSGWGFAVGYVGSIAGLLAALPLARAGRLDAAWLMVAASFGGLALPAILLLGPGGTRTMRIGAAAAHGMRHFAQIFAEVLRLRELRRFLLAYFLYINGVNAAITFAGSFAATTFGLPVDRVIVLFLVVQGSALVGALALAKPTDAWGPKPVVMLSIVLWTFSALGLVFVRDVNLFWATCVVAGIGLGSVQSASRAFMATLIPKGREDEFFGFYATCGRTSAPLGAAAWWAGRAITHSQRGSVAAIIPFFLAGGAVLALVRGGGPTTER